MGFFDRFSTKGTLNRLAERVKQKVGINTGGAGWQPTSNERNTRTLAEARLFNKELKKLVRQICMAEDATKGSIQAMMEALRTPLPCVYVQQGDVVLRCAHQHATVVGWEVNTAIMANAATDLHGQLERNVLQQLKQWQNRYKQAKVRNARLEQQRLELDASRRKAASTQSGRGHAMGLGCFGANSSTWPDDDYRPMLSHEDDRVKGKREVFGIEEKALYDELFALIQDTTNLKLFIGAALVLFQDTFMRASAPFRPDVPPA